MALAPDDVVLGVLPFSHSFGLNGALLAPLLAGAAVVTLDRFVPEDVVTAVARHRVTVLRAVATMFRRLPGSRGVGDGPPRGRPWRRSRRWAMAGSIPALSRG